MLAKLAANFNICYGRQLRNSRKQNWTARVPGTRTYILRYIYIYISNTSNSSSGAKALLTSRAIFKFKPSIESSASHARTYAIRSVCASAWDQKRMRCDCAPYTLPPLLVQCIVVSSVFSFLCYRKTNPRKFVNINTWIKWLYIFLNSNFSQVLENIKGYY